MRMTSNLSGERLSSPFGGRPVRELKDITSKILDIGFPRIVPAAILWRHNVICGLPECGKSATLDDRAYIARQRYRSINIVRTDDLDVAIDLIDDREVQYLQVDDAATYAASIAPYELKDKIATFQKLRHVFEERAGTDTGAVIVDLGWQRWKEVYPTFRNGNTIIFKTGMAEPDDDNMILRTVGDTAHKALHEIWDRMVCGDQEIKSTAIGYIPSRRGQRNASGIYRTTYRKDWPGCPKMIFSSNYFNDAIALEAILDKLRSRGDDWTFKVQCYEMTEIDGMTTTAAAAELGKSQGWISRCAASVKAELARQGVG